VLEDIIIESILIVYALKIENAKNESGLLITLFLIAAIATMIVCIVESLCMLRKCEKTEGVAILIFTTIFILITSLFVVATLRIKAA